MLFCCVAVVAITTAVSAIATHATARFRVAAVGFNLLVYVLRFICRLASFLKCLGYQHNVHRTYVVEKIVSECVLKTNEHNSKTTFTLNKWTG